MGRTQQTCNQQARDRLSLFHPHIPPLPNTTFRSHPAGARTDREGGGQGADEGWRQNFIYLHAAAGLTFRTFSSWNTAHARPASTSNFVTVLIETSHTRSSEGMIPRQEW